jgi:oxygen-independent coproporphyrinogen-3 oxidase
LREVGGFVKQSRCGVYIHVPFCRKRCRFCDYVSFEGKENRVPEYVTALCREIAMRGPGLARTVTSVFIGGGTPGMVGPAGIEFILAACRQYLRLDPDAEITVEGQPDSISPEFVQACRDAGVNRFSLGVVSLNDYILDLLGRSYDAVSAREAFLVLSGLGYHNLSVDLVYGLPAQTQEDCLRGVEEVIDWGATHVSLYALTVVPGTPLYREHKEGVLALASENLVAEMYAEAAHLLEGEGYRRYEISNFARDGFECRHHLIYWWNEPYIGLGVGALSSLDGWRLRNTPRLDEYIQTLGTEGRPASPVWDRRRVDPRDEANDALIQALRQTAGLDIEAFDRIHGGSLLSDRQKQIEALTGAGLVSLSDGRLTLSPKGLMFSGRVFRQFLSLP